MPDESDIWVISKALKLLSYSDYVIADIANNQLSKTISSALDENNIGRFPLGQQGQRFFHLITTRREAIYGQEQEQDIRVSELG